ncbi:TetR/AcrR family transcriptional regulator [Mangrovitalea sediminis]|uniref:TetR/AcrR family transcriptional regulator n=1 Tax=Mangrovitalea sediminis TaxID=1982043 RepID=UPI000BE50941|nr:TetR/AcrR family transcriptional regulator [Mangrovitalea sediminis]
MAHPQGKTAKPARDRILETASRLFYQEGLRATGIDRIIAESGVAKMSFYRHFPSKTDLIVAFLNARHQRWMSWFKGEVDRRIDSEGRLDVIAEVLEEWFQQPDFRGCAFINTVAESGSSSSREREIAVQHKAELADYLETVARKLGLPEPAAMAEDMMVIIEGTIVRRQMTGDRRVTWACHRLIQAISRPYT